MAPIDVWLELKMYDRCKRTNELRFTVRLSGSHVKKWSSGISSAIIAI